MNLASVPPEELEDWRKKRGKYTPVQPIAKPTDPLRCRMSEHKFIDPQTNQEVVIDPQGPRDRTVVLHCVRDRCTATWEVTL